MLFVVVASPFDVIEVEVEFSEDGGELLEDLDSRADYLGSYAIRRDGCNFVDGHCAVPIDCARRHCVVNWDFG